MPTHPALARPFCGSCRKRLLDILSAFLQRGFAPPYNEVFLEQFTENGVASGKDAPCPKFTDFSRGISLWFI
jgi:hypothetical protein